MNKPEKKFNSRAFYSIGMFLSGISLPFTGYMNHRLQLNELDGVREFWMSIHNASGVLFFALTIGHFISNRKVFLNHVKKTKGMLISKEFLLALLLFVIAVILFPLHAFK